MIFAITIFVYIYLIIGFLYALYILLFAGDRWYSFPINMLGGPITIIYWACKSAKNV